jgi:hypothetical protein
MVDPCSISGNGFYLHALEEREPTERQFLYLQYAKFCSYCTCLHGREPAPSLLPKQVKHNGEDIVSDQGERRWTPAVYRDFTFILIGSKYVTFFEHYKKL